MKRYLKVMALLWALPTALHAEVYRLIPLTGTLASSLPCLATVNFLGYDSLKGTITEFERNGLQKGALAATVTLNDRLRPVGMCAADETRTVTALQINGDLNVVVGSSPKEFRGTVQYTAVQNLRNGARSKQRTLSGPVLVRINIGHSVNSSQIQFSIVPETEEPFRRPAINYGLGGLLHAHSIYPPGDANFNCRVDVEDLNIIRNHFGETSSSLLFGDVNFDGQIGIEDLNFVRNSFGATCN